MIPKNKNHQNPCKFPGKILFLFFIAVFLRASPFGISLSLMDYSYFSQQSTGIPMRAGYPLIQARSFLPSVRYRHEREGLEHIIDLSISNIAVLKDSGAADLLDSGESRLFRSSLDYRLHMQLFRWKQIRVDHCFLSGINYENRLMSYKYGAEEKTRDLNLYLGPGLQGDLNLFSDCSLSIYFDARFYLPYLNYGYLQDADEDGVIFFASPYHAFYYQTLLGLEIGYELGNGNVLHIGIKKDDLVGFANRRPRFYPEDIIHYKLERNFHLYLRYDLNTPKMIGKGS